MSRKMKKSHVMKTIACGATLLALLLPSLTSAGTPIARIFLGTVDEDLPTDRLIIKYRRGLSEAAAATSTDRVKLHRQAQDVAVRRGLRLQWLPGGALGVQVMRLERRTALADVQQLAQAIMAADANVEYAEPDRILRPLFTPNDSQYAQQWHYFETTGGINLPAAWDKSTGAGVVVAVIDTGYRPHADLAANILPGYDFISDMFVANDGDGRDSDARDPGDAVLAGECGGGYPSQDETSSWHGTHVAGTVAAVSNNGDGVAGAAYGATVLPVRVLGKCGGYTSDIAAGIVWASGGSVSGVPANANPARVINMSLGGSGACDITSQNAIKAARSRGTVVVVAAGNSNANAANFSPASCKGVVTVAATNRSGGRSFYSNYGMVVAVAAPGGDMRSSAANGILSTLNSGATTPGADSYAYYQGTSMATPQVAAVAALMLQKNASLSPDEVAARLKSSARAFPAACGQCGAGIVDASAAVDAAMASTTSPPPSPPPAGNNNEVEPNDSLGTAQGVTVGATINGTMASSSDNDYFKTSVAAGRMLNARLTPNSVSDYNLYVYDSSGALVGASTNGTGLVDAVSVVNRSSVVTTYYVLVRYYSGGTGSTGGSYSLSIR